VLPQFQAQNPHVEIETVVKRNRHPLVEGTFREWRLAGRRACRAPPP
jgi:hypothetical protein